MDAIRTVWLRHGNAVPSMSELPMEHTTQPSIWKMNVEDMVYTASDGDQVLVQQAAVEVDAADRQVGQLQAQLQLWLH